jgi:nucleoside-diphosphate-sugar epimerase
MKILFFGSRGWIGKQFCEYLTKNNINYIETDIRADNEKEVEKEIITLNPTHIISFIGRTHGENYNTIDYLEQPGKLVDNIRDNLYAPLILSILCKKYNIHYTYMGTGCIFEYNKDIAENVSEDIDEEKSPNFYGSSYSIVKGYTDRLQHMFSENTLNLRIRMPIVNYDHDRNFITKITKYEYICSNPNSMTVLDDMYPVILDMIKNNITGTFNMCNKGVITHNEILELYREYVDSSFTWKNFSIEEQNKILLSKRSNIELSSKKLYDLYPNIPDIKTSIDNCLKNYSKLM